MRHLDEILSGRVTLLMSSSLQVEESIAGADVVIGAVLIPGARAPKLVPRLVLLGADGPEQGVVLPEADVRRELDRLIA